MKFMEANGKKIPAIGLGTSGLNEQVGVTATVNFATASAGVR